MESLYLLLGGNLGDKKLIFDESCKLLENTLGKIVSKSSVYETEPWGFETEDIFWNQVIVIKCNLDPFKILHFTQHCEIELGRIRNSKQYSSRVIDIDILFYGEQIISTENLQIPHPLIAERKFTLVPLCELNPEFNHPVLRKSLSDLLNECTDRMKVTKITV